jgi:two-component system, response regulator
MDMVNNSNSNNKILLVEDNPDDVMLTLRALKKNNILNDVVVAKDGVEAIEFLFGTENGNERDTGTKPLLILLDLKLPRINGLEVLRKIRENDFTRMIPVVILTSSKEEKDIIESYQIGVNAYVRKPVDFIEFTEAVKQIGLFWLLLNESPMKLS